MRPAGRLIGREPVLAAAGTVLQDALAGSGQFLLISGEAGIGKTAVLAELIGQAEQSRRGRAARVLLGGHRGPAVLAVVAGRACIGPRARKISARRPGCWTTVATSRRSRWTRQRRPTRSSACSRPSHAVLRGCGAGQTRRGGDR